jgi:hypothetical protein
LQASCSSCPHPGIRGRLRLGADTKLTRGNHAENSSAAFRSCKRPPSSDVGRTSTKMCTGIATATPATAANEIAGTYIRHRRQRDRWRPSLPGVARAFEKTTRSQIGSPSRREERRCAWRQLYHRPISDRCKKKPAEAVTAPKIAPSGSKYTVPGVPCFKLGLQSPASFPQQSTCQRLATHARRLGRWRGSSTAKIWPPP